MKDLQTGDRLYKHKQGVIDGLNTAKRGFLEAGRHLMIIQTGKLYQNEIKVSFAQWVEGELGISRSTAYQLIAVYEQFGDLLSAPEFENLDYSKAVLLLPYIPDKATVQQKEDLLHMAQGQTVRGLKDNLANMAGKTATDECLHEGDNEIWNRCKKCGKFWK